MKTISPEEQADIDSMKAEKARLLESMFGQMRLISYGTDTLLKASGFASRDAGVVFVFQQTNKKVDELVGAHIKKWRD